MVSVAAWLGVGAASRREGERVRREGCILVDCMLATWAEIFGWGLVREVLS